MYENREGIVSEFLRSGLTQKDFAKKNNLNHMTLHTWVKKFRPKQSKNILNELTHVRERAKEEAVESRKLYDLQQASKRCDSLLAENAKLVNQIADLKNTIDHLLKTSDELAFKLGKRERLIDLLVEKI